MLKGGSHTSTGNGYHGFSCAMTPESGTPTSARTAAPRKLTPRIFIPTSQLLFSVKALLPAADRPAGLGNKVSPVAANLNVSQSASAAAVKSLEDVMGRG
jgi:hypothetical protein